MGSKICMNELCRSTTSSEWKKGWPLRSGEFAVLCSYCGSAYENLIFCDTFHSEESGWRECKLCSKRIHCGCASSKYLFECLDFGGIECIICMKRLETHSMGPVQIPNGDISNGTLVVNGTGNVQPNVIQNRVDENNCDKGRMMLPRQLMEKSEGVNLYQSLKDEITSSPGPIKREESLQSPGESSSFPSLNQQPVGSSIFGKPDIGPKQGAKNIYKSLAQPSLSFSFSTPLGNSSPLLPCHGGDSDGKEQRKASSSQQGQKTRSILPKPAKLSCSNSEANKGPASQRIARPPGEGRGGRNQLLPRYWPRITDQELQKLSGDLNSTIVPLFEKVLSASDAGRIGRLVLPKACAEAYFPPINNSEGLPIRIQDIKGKEWTFQFRFWPNNNSRMYVLEGITPCIQNMQLQAGDTVIFSRIDPGGKLVMGFRKETDKADAQDQQAPILPNGGSPGQASFSEVKQSLPNGKDGGTASEESLQRPMMIQDKKKARNIGSKHKRLHMNGEDVVELRITWEEAQDLLRPHPTAKPTIVTIEDHEFEEYDEPPVIGKRTIFTTGAFGDQEQWAQCDLCSKWRKLPVHVLLPPKWTCSENIWDPKRCSCSAPDEMNSKASDNIFRVNGHFPVNKKPRLAEKKAADPDDCEPSGLDALATVAVLGDNIGDLEEPSATTKHPRHRPGCTCIVCIQPPSGKGKHPPTCKCIVCMTVRRRFKTLMLRKKKRQTEHEAGLTHGKDQVSPKDESETEGPTTQDVPLLLNSAEIDAIQNGDPIDVVETDKGQLDLNCHPSREDEMLAEAAGMSLTSLITSSSHPLELYLKQSGLENLGPDPSLPPKGADENEGHSSDGGITSVDTKMDNNGEVA